MLDYFLAFLVIFAENCLPAFGPPTWLVLVYLTLGFNLEPAPLIVLAVIAASVAHWLMAHFFRRIRNRLPKNYVTNMENLGTKLEKRSKTMWGLFILFLWSPLSSSQLFVAAGLIPQIRIFPLVVAFGIGRCFTYTSYVMGADAFSHTDIGEKLMAEMTSPLMITLQVVLVIGVIALGRIKWKPEGENV
ncbi:MAG: hypothetical protein RL228_1437 [Actinomycetota bacterium]